MTVIPREGLRRAMALSRPAWRDADMGSGEPRVGYYHRLTDRFVGLSDDEAIIFTHFAASERYVRTRPNSTYR